MSSVLGAGDHAARGEKNTAATAAAAAAAVDESSSEILGKLASKSTEVANLSDARMLDLCRELLVNLRTRSEEWSADWPLEEARLLGLVGASPTAAAAADDDASGESSEMSPEALVLAAKARFLLGSAVGSFLATCIDGLERKLGVCAKASDLLDKVRSVKVNEDGEEKECTVWGPASMGGTAPGVSMEVWGVPKVSREKSAASASASKSTEDKGDDGTATGVTVVLGAGNQPMLTAVDALQRCLVDREAVLIKHHPLRPFLMKPYGILLEPLIQRGYIDQIVDGGIPATTSLLSDMRVKHVHITGSLDTDKAIRATLQRSRPALCDEEIRRMVTAELGCATPWIFSPGQYSETELIHAVRMVVAGKKSNGGCNCLAAQVVIIAKDWDQKDELRAALVKELKRQPTQPSYYPGSRERRESIREKYESLGRRRSSIVKAPSHGAEPDPRDDTVLVECGTPGEDGFEGTALKTEAFGSVLAIVELNGGADLPTYFDAGVAPFVNNSENIYGSLSCSLIVPGSADAATIERAIASLRYGSVAVNTWSAVGYFALAKGGTWGAHTQDMTRQSGSGFVGNLFGLPDVAKTVVRGPPLTTTPMFDVAKEPPPIVFDAIHALTCAPSTMVGLANLLKLMFSRTATTMLSPLLRMSTWFRQAILSTR